MTDPASSTLVERLREVRGVLDNRWPGPTVLELEAATRITELEAERDCLKLDHQYACQEIAVAIAERDETRAQLERVRAETWRTDLQNAPGGVRFLIAGQYPNGIWYVEESYRHYAGHFNGRKISPPTHWRSLPAPPQQKTENNA